MAIVASYSSHLPDKIEQDIFITSHTWEKYHRTFFHWLPLYLFLIYFLYSYLAINNMFLPTNEPSQFLSLLRSNPINNGYLPIIIGNMFLWALVGCVFHILEDSICGKIPLLSPFRKVKIIRLFYTGSAKEYLFDIVFCILIVFLSMIH